MKTNRIKHNLDRKPLSSEEINGMQDFNQVLKKSSGGSKGSSGYKSLLYVAGAAIIGLLTWGILEFTQPNSERQVEKNTPETTPRTQEDPEDLVGTPLVKPPVVEWDIPFSNYSLNAETGGQIVHGGTRIDVPAQCMIDKAGNIVRGEVIYKYREFHDGLDFALSGIPMTYDSAGVQYIFESAGMCELRAYQNEEEVFLAENKEIKIDMVSYQDGDYNLYRLDEEQKNWMNKGNTKATREPGHNTAMPASDTIAETALLSGNTVSSAKRADNSEIHKVQKEIATIKENKPVPPKKANAARPHLNLEISTDEFPELASFTNVTFEVVPEDKEFKPQYFDITWTDIRLERYSEDRFKMKLILDAVSAKSDKEKVVTLIVVPVIPDKDYPDVKAKYDELMKEYNTKLNNRLKEEEELRKKAEAEAKAARELAERQAKEWEEQVKQTQKHLKNWNDASRFAQSAYGDFRRSFSMDKLGIWNSDNPVYRNSASVLFIDFESQNDQPLDVATTYQLINNNSLMCNYFMGCCNNSLTYKKKDKYVLFTILKDGKLAYTKDDSWKSKEANSKIKLKMNVTDQKFRSANEVRKYLGLDSPH